MVAILFGPGPVDVMRRFGSKLGAGSFDGPLLRTKINGCADVAGAWLACGAASAEDAADEALLAATTSGGFVGMESARCGALASMGSACGRSRGTAISAVASAH